jgi:SagB-type dehydrogenase family enzyme
VRAQSTGSFDLPAPATRGSVSVEEALAARRSVREFAADPLTAAQLSQLLWSAQGVTGRQGLRAAPSAGALYPLEVYVATAGGVHHYEPRAHRLVARTDRDLRSALARAALGQACVAEAPAVFVIAAVQARVEVKYGRARSPRYVHLEAGHAAQNLLLQATALGLGGVPVGAFEDDEVQAVLGLPRDHRPVYLVPVGKPRASR